MKRKFIGRVKDDKFIRWFLFWIPVRQQKRKQNTLTEVAKDLKQLEARLSDISCQIRESQLTIQGQFSQLYTAIQNIRSVDLYARLHHPETFQKYKGIHKGKEVVIVGAGPSLNDYTPIPGAIHIGVNRTYRSKTVELDYLFMQDGGPANETQELTNYRKGKCRKFFGIHPIPSVCLISDLYAEENQAERYYFYNPHPLDSYISPPVDLAHQPLQGSFSTVIPAFQFALWSHPARIYVVGCDCSQAGYFAADKHLTQVLPVDSVIQEWKRMAEFAKRHYPDVEIISINPVGLRGLFKDCDTIQKAQN